MRLQPTLRVSIVKFKLLDVIPKALVFCFAFRWINDRSVADTCVILKVINNGLLSYDLQRSKLLTVWER